jgi:hypothetical protein
MRSSKDLLKEGVKLQRNSDKAFAKDIKAGQQPSDARITERSNVNKAIYRMLHRVGEGRAKEVAKAINSTSKATNAIPKVERGEANVRK